ncbi:MAG: PaaI family thioesterase [bacterium]
MEKIINPYINRPDYNCFGCSPENKFGLQMSFFEEEDEVLSIWQPQPHFAGYKNVLHGGIISTLIDEIAAWTVTGKLHLTGVTSKIEVKYLKPVFIDKGNITLKSKIVSNSHKLAEINVKIFDSNNTLCTIGTVFYYILDKEKTENLLF